MTYNICTQQCSINVLKNLRYKGSKIISIRIKTFKNVCSKKNLIQTHFCFFFYVIHFMYESSLIYCCTLQLLQPDAYPR